MRKRGWERPSFFLKKTLAWAAVDICDIVRGKHPSVKNETMRYETNIREALLKGKAQYNGPPCTN